MVHYVFWLFSGGAPASQPARGGGGEGGGFPKPPSHPAAARRSSLVLCARLCAVRGWVIVRDSQG